MTPWLAHLFGVGIPDVGDYTIEQLIMFREAYKAQA